MAVIATEPFKLQGAQSIMAVPIRCKESHCYLRHAVLHNGDRARQKIAPALLAFRHQRDETAQEPTHVDQVPYLSTERPLPACAHPCFG